MIQIFATDLETGKKEAITDLNKHVPNADTYRPLLGRATNLALFRLVEKKNAVALEPLGANDYLRKMIRHWWEAEFPGEPFPGETKPYFEDFDFVQSV